MKKLSNKTIIDIKGIDYRYEKNNVLENISFSLEEGSFLALVGPNGSGKSTLLKLMLGLLPLQKGKIELFGEDIKSFKQWEKIGFVSQKANSFNTGFPATVYEVVASGLTKKVGLFKWLSKEDKQKVKDAIEAVSLTPYMKQNIGELSGGQQQRVFIARALVSEPKLLILDEPTVGVDVVNVNAFYEMLEELNKKRNITLLLVTHEFNSVSTKVTHVACLNKCLHFHGVTEDYEKLDDEKMSQIYGHEVKRISHNHDHSSCNHSSSRAREGERS